MDENEKTKEEDLPEDFVNKCKSVKAKRPRTVIDHILKHGYITTEELRHQYGYNHPPRAARDVREHGIPIETFNTKGSDGRSIGAYRFGDPEEVRGQAHQGRTNISKKVKEQLIKSYGPKCAIYLEKFDEHELEVDHRIPYEVAGERPDPEDNVSEFMLLSPSANRAKSWSCEHCANFLHVKDPSICSRCYWAFPEDYDHIAMREVRRVDLLWSGEELKTYERLKEETLKLQKDLPQYIKDIIESHLNK